MNAPEKRTNYPTFTVDEFKDRIRSILGLPSSGTQGAAKSHPCVVRKPTDPGYYPPAKTKGKKHNEITPTS